MKVKLKGMDFFTAGEKGKNRKEGDGLVILGELEDGRRTTICVPWDAEIHIESQYPWVIASEVGKEERGFLVYNAEEV